MLVNYKKRNSRFFNSLLVDVYACLSEVCDDMLEVKNVVHGRFSFSWVNLLS
jgi:hypothetical protein